MILEYYKSFIDELVNCAEHSGQDMRNISAALVGHKQVPTEPAGLSPETSEQAVFDEIYRIAWRAGVRSAIEYLDKKIAEGSLKLQLGGAELPCRPFLTEMAFDWTMRCDGVSWPDERRSELDYHQGLFEKPTR